MIRPLLAVLFGLTLFGVASLAAATTMCQRGPHGLIVCTSSGGGTTTCQVDRFGTVICR